jgi:hypothetical protein
MASFFDLNSSAGQFRALALLYLVTVALRCWGFTWAEQDHTLILGALLALLRGHIQEVAK